MVLSAIPKTLQMPMFWGSVIIAGFFGSILRFGGRPGQHPDMTIKLYLGGFIFCGFLGMVGAFYQSFRIVKLQKTGTRMLARLIDREGASVTLVGPNGAAANVSGGVLSKLRYEYDVNGTTYQNTTYPISTSLLKKAAMQPIYIYYNPSKPSSSAWEGE